MNTLTFGAKAFAATPSLRRKAREDAVLAEGQELSIHDAVGFMLKHVDGKHDVYVSAYVKTEKGLERLADVYQKMGPTPFSQPAGIFLWDIGDLDDAIDILYNVQGQYTANIEHLQEAGKRS